MPEIADQTIGNINRGRRDTAQLYAESDPRRGPQKCVPTRAGFVGAKNNPAGVMRESFRDPIEPQSTGQDQMCS